jgi:starch phosphorylase
MTQPAERLPQLPESLRALEPLARNLRWVWNHGADYVWSTLNAEVWQQTRNPVLVLRNTPRSRYEKLAYDGEFLWRLEHLARHEREYLTRPSWYQRAHPAESPPLTAYFSMEYGLTDALPLYSGGLGVLAGDHLKTASDLGVPLVAVGIFYREGYFRQMLDAEGRQLEIYAVNSPGSLPVTRLTDAEGMPLRIGVELPGRDLRLRIWRADVGRVPLYLLDSDDPLNTPCDRAITAKLYAGDGESRLMQEIVLGIGGWRALEALGHVVDVCHLNEGHAAFATLERARRFAEQNACDFMTALWATRAGNVFTTHTPVAAAFDVFPPALMQRYGVDYARLCGLAPARMLALGRVNPDDAGEPFNMAYLAMRCCLRTNGVSELHGRVSRGIFAPLYPRWPQEEVPVTHVTNAVHVPSWDSPWADQLWTTACGKDRWLGAPEQLGESMARLSDRDLWDFRAKERLDLVQYARRRLVRQLSQRGAGEAVVAAAKDVLDPTVLTLGFARRFTEYKRPAMLLAQPERLVRLLTHPERPVQLIIAGKAHPRDEPGRRYVQQWAQFVQRPEVRARAVFVEDYDLALAEQLVHGVDVWLNTPRRTWEASGTSGMKTLVNGGLNLSERDGWWAEAWSPEVGWALGDGDDLVGSDRDAQEVEQLFAVLEAQVVPEFYDRDADGVPHAWVARIRASLAQLTPRFSSNRMVAEYLDRLYLPAAADFQRRRAHGTQLAAELKRWNDELSRHWTAIRWGACEVSSGGGVHTFDVQVHLGQVPPQGVAVQLYLAPWQGRSGAVFDLQRGTALADGDGGYHFVGEVPGDRPASHYTPRVVPAHPEAKIPTEARRIRWYPD